MQPNKETKKKKLCDFIMLKRMFWRKKETFLRDF